MVDNAEKIKVSFWGKNYQIPWNLRDILVLDINFIVLPLRRMKMIKNHKNR